MVRAVRLWTRQGRERQARAGVRTGAQSGVGDAQARYWTATLSLVDADRPRPGAGVPPGAASAGASEADRLGRSRLPRMARRVTVGLFDLGRGGAAGDDAVRIVTARRHGLASPQPAGPFSPDDSSWGESRGALGLVGESSRQQRTRCRWGPPAAVRSAGPRRPCGARASQTRKTAPRVRMPNSLSCPHILCCCGCGARASRTPHMSHRRPTLVRASARNPDSGIRYYPLPNGSGRSRPNTAHPTP